MIDVLVRPGGIRRFLHPRIASTSTHGTGCTLSAAITAGLALGRNLERAVEDGIDFVQRAIRGGAGIWRRKGAAQPFCSGAQRGTVGLARRLTV